MYESVFYLCAIFFGIIIYLLWNGKDGFSIGGQIDLISIESQCGIDFDTQDDYANIGVNDRYDCCNMINTQSIDSSGGLIYNIQENTENLLNQNIDFPNYSSDKQNNIKEFIVGCIYNPIGYQLCSNPNDVLAPEMNLNLDLNGNSNFNCINPCNNLTNPCQNGGSCTDENICNCVNGYTGTLCQIQPPAPAPVPAPVPVPAPAPTGSILNTALILGTIAGVGAACAVLNNRPPNIQNNRLDSSSSDEESSDSDSDGTSIDSSVEVQSNDGTLSDSTSSGGYSPVPSPVPSTNTPMIGDYGGSSSLFGKNPQVPQVCTPGSPDCP